MKYDALYPEAKDQDEPEQCIVYFDKEGPCIICTESTHFVDLDFEAHICSEECSWALWEQYVDACAESDKRGQADEQIKF